MTIKTYIAGKFSAQERLRDIRSRLNNYLDVSSSWMDETYTDANAPQEVMLENAERDVKEVREADLFILDTLDESATGGREVELGIALAEGLNIWIVGPKRNIFHSLADGQFDSWDEVFKHLQS